MKKFQKRLENFVCEFCGHKVIGSGYTDHCPNCLTSKHVDLNPGDRQAKCGGLMKPIGLRKKNSRWQLLYRCQKCGYQKYNQVEELDNREILAKISCQ